MSFFKKLKDRLFKSSSKIDEGLEAIVQEASEDTRIDQDQEEVQVVGDGVDNIKVVEELPPAPEPAPEAGPVVYVYLYEDQDEDPEPEPEPTGIIGKIFKRTRKNAISSKRALDNEMIEQLEELLISADIGVDTALRVVSNMAQGNMGKRLSVDEIKLLLAKEVERIMEPVAKPLPIFAQTPQVILVVGVNGAGKTTTIGKIASQLKAADKSVIIAAGDTFRAAAVEQLQIWGERADVPVLTAPEGSDPASLAYDSLSKAQEEGSDILMIDTAGRLQNRTDLMEELAKIVRVLKKKEISAPHNTLLVLDATTGQNALSQVKIFKELVDITGLVMTKLDGTAK